MVDIERIKQYSAYVDEALRTHDVIDYTQLPDEARSDLRERACEVWPELQDAQDLTRPVAESVVQQNVTFVEKMAQVKHAVEQLYPELTREQQQAFLEMNLCHHGSRMERQRELGLPLTIAPPVSGDANGGN